MRRLARSEGGFGLIELLIAMTVMVIAIMAIVAAFSSGMVSLGRAAQASTAATVADKQMEAYRALPNCAIYLDSSAIVKLAVTRFLIRTRLRFALATSVPGRHPTSRNVTANAKRKRLAPRPRAGTSRERGKR